MKCHIEYVGKLRNGTPQYYCTNHKSFASDKKGMKLESCLCNTKDIFDKTLNLEEVKIENLKIIYENLLKKTIPKMIINNEAFHGVLKYKECLLSYKDLGGILLSKLNKIDLEEVHSVVSKHHHSNNGKFAYTPHKTHLCLYCGHLFRVKEKNIGNELNMIFSIPDLQLKENTIKIEEKCCIEYDLLKGILLINNISVNNLIIKNKKMSVVEFLNKTLENEF